MYFRYWEKNGVIVPGVSGNRLTKNYWAQGDVLQCFLGISDGTDMSNTEPSNIFEAVDTIIFVVVTIF